MKEILLLRLCMTINQTGRLFFVDFYRNAVNVIYLFYSLLLGYEVRELFC